MMIESIQASKLETHQSHQKKSPRLLIENIDWWLNHMMDQIKMQDNKIKKVLLWIKVI